MRTSSKKNRILPYKDNLIELFCKYTKVCQWRSSAGLGSASQYCVKRKGIYVQLFNIADAAVVKEDYCFSDYPFILLPSLTL